MPERHDHGKNLIGTVRIERFAKLFILRAFDVYANDKGLFNIGDDAVKVMEPFFAEIFDQCGCSRPTLKFT